MVILRSSFCWPESHAQWARNQTCHDRTAHTSIQSSRWLFWGCVLVAFLWWCCGCVFVVVFLRWCFCGGVLVVLFVVVFLWRCFCGGAWCFGVVWCVVVFVRLCFVMAFLWWCFGVYVLPTVWPDVSMLGADNLRKVAGYDFPPTEEVWRLKYVGPHPTSMATFEESARIFVVVVFLWWCFQTSPVLWSDGCRKRLSSNIAESSAEVMAVFKDCHQTSPMSSKTAQSSIEVMDVVKDCHQTSPKVLLKWWLSLKIVIKDRPKFYWSDACLKRLSSKTAQSFVGVMAVFKDCHQYCWSCVYLQDCHK